ncbi:MAG TPA: hypothetical protein DET40_09875 [Lentisphaeria bacterium]|nr:MAG: hypothetical protein A2X45_08660 [Lentisphaerae bacterium GWF2_50_93]HCE43843.1 hypothetical protein [Lentisphaeria bacterium]
MDEDIKKWDEYKWEGIFREEDQCINAYMKELPRYIDLPDEEEILFNRIRKMQKALPEANLLYDKLYEYQNSFEDEEPCLPEDWRNLQGADIYKKVLEYACAWTRLYVSAFNSDTMNLGLKGACMYAIMLSRIIGVMEMPADMPALVISSCKRVNSVINDIIGLTNEISRLQPNLSIRMNDQSSRLLLVREKVLALMEENRKKIG